MTIWGNHSNTQYPDLFHCEVGGKTAYEAVGDHEWVDETYIPTVATRGGAIIKARGASSAASAANAAVDHIRSWSLGTPEGDWVSMGVPSDGSYGVPEGIISSFPCVCSDGKYEIVQGLEIDDYSRGQDRRLRRRARRRARRRRRTRPDLIDTYSDLDDLLTSGVETRVVRSGFRHSIAHMSDNWGFETKQIHVGGEPGPGDRRRARCRSTRRRRSSSATPSTPRTCSGSPRSATSTPAS